MIVATKLMTAEEFWQRASEFSHCELVRGVVVPKGSIEMVGGDVSPTGGKHGEIEHRLSLLLGDFLRQKRIGSVYGGEVGFVLQRDPDVVRAPDLAFVSYARLPESPEGFVPLAPDLAIEIVSPNDSARQVQREVMEYLDADTRLIWIVDPDTQTVTVYRSRADIRVLDTSETLDGGLVLPGFSISVSEIFPA